MQPYFFPYLGYFQLIAASDTFVLHDDVQYIKHGWVNRNQILLRGGTRMITFPVRKDSHSLPINARQYVSDVQARKDILNLIRTAYVQAPCFANVFPLVEQALMFDDHNVARFNENLIRRITAFIGIDRRIIVSSGMDKNNALAGEARVIDICKALGASTYINPIGGTTLYDHDHFEAVGIRLRFLKSSNTPYRQGNQPWMPSMSIIDVLMYNTREVVHNLLDAYTMSSAAEIQAVQPSV